MMFYRFGRDAAQVGPLHLGKRKPPTQDATTVFLDGIKPDEPATGAGEALRQVLDQNRGQAVERRARGHGRRQQQWLAACRGCAADVAKRIFRFSSMASA